MFQFAAFKKDTFALGRVDVLCGAMLVDAEFTAISGLPICIEVHDHRVLPAVVVLKLIYMLFVKATCIVQSIVKFVSRNACVAGAVQIQHKFVHQFEEQIFIGIVVTFIQPVNLITSVQFVLGNQGMISGSCILHQLISVQSTEVDF